jgi:DNA recombination protein RmuC
MVAERLQKLGGTLQTVSTQYNSVVTAVAGQQGLSGKVSRFSELSAKANKAMPALAPLHVDLEVHRLSDVVPVKDGESDTQ